MNDYKDLFYHQVSFKASHNSYELRESLTEQIERYNCRGLELDIAQSGDGSKWSVSHDIQYHKDIKQLDQYLQELDPWSQNNKGHDIITVYLDLKLVDRGFILDETFPPRLDSYIRNNFDEGKIVTPQSLIRNGQNLSASTASKQWGKLRELENKFIFCLTGFGDILKDFIGDESIKSSYTIKNFAQRLCFTDVDRSQQEQPASDLVTKGNRIFFNYNFHQKIDQKIFDKNWTDKIKLNAQKSNVILRTYTIDNEKDFKLAMQTGFNIISVDLIQKPWATVGINPFA